MEVSTDSRKKSTRGRGKSASLADFRDRIKAAASGRTIDVLADVAGVSRELLNGRHHPCPKCGGHDRFRLVDDAAGAVMCSQCFFQKNGDYISAVQHYRGISFRDALSSVADYLGVHKNGDHATTIDNRNQPAAAVNGESARGEAVEKSSRCPPDVADAAYRLILSNPSFALSSSHREQLRRRGLDDSAIESGGYRTMPPEPNRLLAVLAVRQQIPRWKEVPGMLTSWLGLAGHVGLVFPVRDTQGRVVALCVRPDMRSEKGGKYAWVTSRTIDGDQAPSPGAPANVSRGTNTQSVILVEGILKSGIAAALSGETVVGFGGVQNWPAALAAAKEMGAATVRLAFDADSATNHAVARCQVECAEAVVAAGLSLELARWSMADGKGIDDLLAAKKQPGILAGDTALAAAREILVAAEKAAAEKKKASADGDDAREDETEGSEEAADSRESATELDPGAEAKEFLNTFRVDGQVTLRYWRGTCWKWEAGCYRELEKDEVRGALIRHLDKSYVRLGTAITSNVADHVKAHAGLASRTEPPAWIGDQPASWPASELLATRTKIVHLPSLARGADCVADATPRLFTTAALDFDFDPAAPMPQTWLTFLSQLWPDDPASIATLQEWMGLLLTPDTTHQKILLLLGPKRSGKGTIARVTRDLIGPANVAGPTLASFGQNFGLSSLVGRLAAIVSDARLGGRSDQAAITERLLSISGEDALDIDRKFLPVVNCKLTTRLMILTNELPRLSDASGALAGRFIALRLTESFYGREDHELTAKLKAELPGILLWAIAGWQRLRERGRFVQPESGAELLGDLSDITSPVAVFLRERCMVGPQCRVAVDDLFSAWGKWCEANGREHPGTVQTFGRDLAAVVPELRRARPRENGERIRAYDGIGLKASW